MNSQIPATYEKKVQCLFCHEPFSTTRIRSRFIRIERVDSDFYQEYKDPNLNPYYYEVDVCPYCGFAFSENFAPDFPPGAREDVAHALKD